MRTYATTAATAMSTTVTRSKSSTTDAVDVSSRRQCTRSETAWPMEVQGQLRCRCQWACERMNASHSPKWAFW